MMFEYIGFARPGSEELFAGGEVPAYDGTVCSVVKWVGDLCREVEFFAVRQCHVSAFSEWYCQEWQNRPGGAIEIIGEYPEFETYRPADDETE